MASASRISMSLLFILAAASMSMLAASSNTIQTQNSSVSKDAENNIFNDLTTYEQCFSSISECFSEIDVFFRAIARGLPLNKDFDIAPSCCNAIMDIHKKCWLLLFPDPFHSLELRTFCARQSSQAAGAPAPAQSPVPGDDPGPVSAPLASPWFVSLSWF